MPARDLYHDQFKNALINDGWNITHDPLRLSWGDKDMYVDLGAERLLAAQKNECFIAVEIKSFTGPSDMEDLEKAVGQYVLYRSVLAKRDPRRELYLAVTEKTWHDIFEKPLGKLLLNDELVRMVSFDPTREVICQWIP